MPATTKRQKTAHATHFPKDVLAHILSYCEDPMILYKRQHARVWRTISVLPNNDSWLTKIYATVNGERKSRLVLNGYMQEHTNYQICSDCEGCIMHTPCLCCPDCDPDVIELLAGLPWYGKGGLSYKMVEDDSDTD